MLARLTFFVVFANLSIYIYITDQCIDINSRTSRQTHTTSVGQSWEEGWGWGVGGGGGEVGKRFCCVKTRHFKSVYI